MKTAAQAAIDAEINGFSDWYLPALDELIEMYNTIGNGGQEGNIGGFDSLLSYWASTEFDSNRARVVGFGDGGVTQFHKNNTHVVRPIRSF